MKLFTVTLLTSLTKFTIGNAFNAKNSNRTITTPSATGLFIYLFKKKIFFFSFYFCDSLPYMHKYGFDFEKIYFGRLCYQNETQHFITNDLRDAWHDAMSFFIWLQC